MANNGLFDFNSGIQFQPDVQARYEAWKADPRNAAAIAEVVKKKGPWGALTAGYQAALDAGVLTPQDFANPANNPSNVAIDARGQVANHESVTKGLGPALVLGGAMFGGSLLAGGAGGSAPIGPGLTTGSVNSTIPSVVGSTSKSWLGPLIGTGLSTAGNIIGAKITANANSDAARIQQEYNDKALAAAKEEQDYKRAQFGNYLNRLQPYANGAQPALTRVADLLNPSNISGPAR